MKNYKEISTKREIKELRIACSDMLKVIQELHKIVDNDKHRKLCEECMNKYDGVANMAKQEELAWKKCFGDSICTEMV